MADLKKIFVEEAAEILSELEPKVLALEKGGRSSPQVLNDVFRLVHTLKGSAGIAGVSGVAGLTHRLEDLLDAAREGELEVEGDFIDLLLVVCDTLKAMLLELEEGIDAQPPQELLEQLAAYGGKRCEKVPKDPPVGGQTEPEGGEKTYHITLDFGRDFFRRGHNLDYLIEDLKQLGRVEKISVDTCRLPPLSELCPDDYWLVWKVTLATEASKEEIEDIFAFVLDEENRLLIETGDTGAAKENMQAEAIGWKTLPADVPARHAARAAFKIAREDADALLGLAGELIIAKNSLPYLAKKAEGAGLGELARQLSERYHYLDRIAREIQDRLMDIRLLPVSEVFGRFPRYVRDQAKKLGKLVDLIISGEETRLDRTIVEELYEPLLHLVRNSLDHGIELPEEREKAGKTRAGQIRLEAWRQGERVIVRVTDDGRGIDAQAVCRKALSAGLVSEEQVSTMTEEEKLRLVFLPGLSQKEGVSDLSGRGVGMDAVESAVRRLGGSVALTTVSGRGTEVTLSLPFTAATTEVLLVEAGGALYGIPLAAVKETVRLEAHDLKTFRGRPVALLRGEIIPVVHCAGVLGGCSGGAEGVMVVLHQRAALVVDRVAGREEIILKPLPGELKKLPFYLGGAVLGDGRVLLVVEPAELVTKALLDRRTLPAGQAVSDGVIAAV